MGFATMKGYGPVLRTNRPDRRPRGVEGAGQEGSFHQRLLRHSASGAYPAVGAGSESGRCADTGAEYRFECAAAERAVAADSEPEERARIALSLEAVDAVTLFDEDTPRELVAAVLPDVLVKGADWSHFIAGREEVEAAGGTVLPLPLEPGYSTTNIVDEIVRRQL